MFCFRVWTVQVALDGGVETMCISQVKDRADARYHGKAQGVSNTVLSK